MCTSRSHKHTYSHAHVQRLTLQKQQELLQMWGLANWLSEWVSEWASERVNYYFATDCISKHNISISPLTAKVFPKRHAAQTADSQSDSRYQSLNLSLKLSCFNNANQTKPNSGHNLSFVAISDRLRSILNIIERNPLTHPINTFKKYKMPPQTHDKTIP
jgi:hypothetical protein